jgi:predicted Zn-dependent protease
MTNLFNLVPGASAIRVAAAFLALLTAGCAVNPVTGERELSLISEAQEIAIGEQQFQPAQQSQGGQYVVDAALQRYVADIGQRLAAVSERPELPYDFVVLNNSVPNAWALPGGKIAVNRGLLLQLEDEAELAAVVGHEIVHAAARHSATQMSRGTLVNLTAQLATIMAATQGYGDVGNMASQLGSAAFMARYGREDELEADRYGMVYMSRLGYDPQAAVSLQETFVKLNSRQQQDFVSGLFASHPPSLERVEANRARAAGLPPGQRHRERYQQHIAQLKRDAPAYEKQDEAVTALKAGQPQQALTLLDQAVKLQPAEAQFWETRGHAWSLLERPANAEKAYTTSIGKNPDLFSPRLYRGLLRYEQQDRAGALQDLEQAHTMLPTAVSAFYLGELALERGDQAAALAYYDQVTQSGNRQLANRARQRLASVELGSSPHKYLPSEPFVGSDGYLRVAVRNDSGVAVTDVRIQLVEMSGAGATLPGSYSLAPGQQIEVRTGVGPLRDANQARGYRSRVVQASPAQ